MEAKKPKISVIMPAYNSEKYIVEAIESILSQTFSDFEFLILNDASTDRTLEIIEEYAKKDDRIRVFNNKEENLHVARGLNLLLKNSSSEMIARMDSDDVALPERLEKQYQLLLDDENIAVVGSYIEIMNEGGEKIMLREYPREDSEIKKVMLRYSPFAHPATMYRKSIVEEFGCYNPVKFPSEDINLWFRIGTKYKFANIPEVLFKYRFFETSTSNSRLRQVELKTLRIRLHAIFDLGYKPSILDILYNIGQAATIYLMSAKQRILLFNFVRKYL